VALGVSAYAGAIFHLMTHAFFKALLFLAAGSVIIAMHHEQDMRRMGGLRKYMPVTYWTCVIGALALIGFPAFSGFFSKDALIEAVGLSTLRRALRLLVRAHRRVRHGLLHVPHGVHDVPRPGTHGRAHREHLHESPWVVTVPLVLLAIPSVVIGWRWWGRCCSATTSGTRCTSPRHTTCWHASASTTTGRGASCCTDFAPPFSGSLPRASCSPGTST